MTIKRAFSEKEASTYIGMSRSFLRKGRMNGELESSIPPPPHIRMGSRTIRYLREDLDAWLEQFKRKTEKPTPLPSTFN